MNTDLVNHIYRATKKYLEEKSLYSPRVRDKSLKESDKFPLVTITEDDNVNILNDTTFLDSTDRLNLTVNIYTQDKAVGNTTVSSVNIGKELANLVDIVIGRKYRMTRTMCKPTPNLDNSIYRITMKYTRKMITGKKILL